MYSSDSYIPDNFSVGKTDGTENVNTRRFNPDPLYPLLVLPVLCVTLCFQCFPYLYYRKPLSKKILIRL
jgi:hypothetical protein